MKTLLYVSYFFPPLGGGGVQRSLKFARYLPSHGWRPIVVTAGSRGYWLEDPTLLDELPPGVRVVRTASPDGVSLAALGRSRKRRTSLRRGGATRRLRRLASLVLVPDVYVPWKPFALRAARRIMREERIDAILTTSSPDSAHLIGLDLRRESRVPWVADFRDPWTRRIAFDPPTPLHRRVHEHLERRVVGAAELVVVTARETGEELGSRLALPEDRLALVPNGFDREDLPDPIPAPRFDRFRLRYAGQLTSGRTLAPLVAALERFLLARPEARDVLEVTIIGPREAENDAIVAASWIGDRISLEGPRAHREALRALVDAHVVLLVEANHPSAGLIAQGKLYECLATTRPVLAIVPPGAVPRLLSELGGGVAAAPDDPDASVAFLDRAFDAWREGRLLPGAGAEPLARFERCELASVLAGHLNRLTV